LALDHDSAHSGKYTITLATLSLSTHANNKKTAKNFYIKRGDQGELDLLEIPQRGSGTNEEVWVEGRAREALLAAHEVLSDALSPAVNDPDTEIGQLANFASNIDTSFRSFTQSLETALSKLAEQREAEQAHNEKERARLRKEHEEEHDRLLQAANEQIKDKTRVLDAREEELAAREAELEIKSHKDSRRQLFNALQDDLKDRTRAPSASFTVLLSRWAIFFTLVGAGSVSAGFALSSMSPDILPEAASTFQIWTVILKPIGLSALALGSFAGAVQWLRHFYTQDLKNALEIQRFGHDMARASWIMEAYLEITKEHGIDQVPESWMRNATEGMFQTNRGNHAIDDSAQALAALLGMSATVTAGPNGLEATLGKRGLRKIAKASQDEVD